MKNKIVSLCKKYKKRSAKYYENICSKTKFKIIFYKNNIWGFYENIIENTSKYKDLALSMKKKSKREKLAKLIGQKIKKIYSISKKFFDVYIK